MNQNKLDKLFEAYLETDYVVKDAGIEMVIRIGEQNPALDKLFVETNENTGAFLTAYNPFSQQLSSEENESRQTKLFGILKERNFKIFNGYGKGKDNSWQPEPSFLILGIDLEEGFDLAYKFEQNAFVYLVKGEAPNLVNSSKSISY